jgi:hypothetical protein
LKKFRGKHGVKLRHVRKYRLEIVQRVILVLRKAFESFFCLGLDGERERPIFSSNNVCRVEGLKTSKTIRGKVGGFGRELT